MKKILFVFWVLFLVVFTAVSCVETKDDGIKPITLEPDSEYVVSVLPHDSNFIFARGINIASDYKIALEKARCRAIFKLFNNVSPGTFLTLLLDSQDVAVRYGVGLVPLRFVSAVITEAEEVEKKVFWYPNEKVYIGFVLLRIPTSKVNEILEQSVANDTLNFTIYEYYRMLLVEKIGKHYDDDWLIDGRKVLDKEKGVMDTLKMIFENKEFRETKKELRKRDLLFWE